MSKLEEVLQDIEKLQEAKQLLEELYLELGPYCNGQISTKTNVKLQKYFNFDDSE